MAFTPCLQYQYAAGKNTADIALALDALELMFDGRVETFCIVTSDSDFAYLCRKLRGRGANVCDHRRSKSAGRLAQCLGPVLRDLQRRKPEQAKSEPPAKVVKRRPRTLLAAVSLLAAETAEGWVGLGALGQYRTARAPIPVFRRNNAAIQGCSTLVQTYPDLLTRLDNGGHRVQPKPKLDAAKPLPERAQLPPDYAIRMTATRLREFGQRHHFAEQAMLLGRQAPPAGADVEETGDEAP